MSVNKMVMVHIMGKTNELDDYNASVFTTRRKRKYEINDSLHQMMGIDYRITSKASKISAPEDQTIKENQNS